MDKNFKDLPLRSGVGIILLNNENKVDEVKSIFSDLNIQKHTVDLIKAYYTKAMKHLDAINSDKKEPLFNFAEKIKERIV